MISTSAPVRGRPAWILLVCAVLVAACAGGPPPRRPVEPSGPSSIAPGSLQPSAGPTGSPSAGLIDADRDTQHPSDGLADGPPDAGRHAPPDPNPTPRPTPTPDPRARPDAEIDGTGLSEPLSGRRSFDRVRLYPARLRTRRGRPDLRHGGPVATRWRSSTGSSRTTSMRRRS